MHEYKVCAKLKLDSALQSNASAESAPAEPEMSQKKKDSQAFLKSSGIDVLPFSTIIIGEKLLEK